MSLKASKSVPVALSEEGLLGKSKAYILRAFRAKSESDFDEYQLWSSLALELLGKAALARIHPSLVVDPTHLESLLAASGVLIGTDFKTITTKTLYFRLRALSKYFDKSVHKFCDDISLRRNAELHSGEVPFKHMKIETWESKFWHSAQIILAMLGSSLEEWLGADKARAPIEQVKHAQEAAVQAAIERVEQARLHFEERSKGDRAKAIEESQTKMYYDYPSLFRLIGAHKWATTCPACTSRAFLSGISYDEEILESDPEVDEEEVWKLYGADEFRCPVCELHLDSREEIEAAGVDPDHEETESRERVYEPEYGNC